MKRQQQTASPGMPKSLQPGHYLSWQQRIYRVTALEPTTTAGDPCRDHPGQ